MPKANFLGVFFTRGVLAEPGGRTVGEQRKQYWFVWQDGLSKAYLAQQLNPAYLPQGKPRLLPGDTFRQAFTREPGVRAVPTAHPDVADYIDKVFVRGSRESEDTTLVTGRLSRRFEAPEPAAGGKPSGPAPAPRPGRIPEPGPARDQDREAKDAPASAPEELDRSLRTEFAMNVMRFRRGDRNEAVRAFRRVVGVSDGIVAAHKHMFTDFGMDLRKSHLNELALSSFRRALELSPDDSHALFNVARGLYELGKYREARDHVDKALKIEPDLTCARRLKEEIRARVAAFIPQE